MDISTTYQNEQNAKLKISSNEQLKNKSNILEQQMKKINDDFNVQRDFQHKLKETVLTAELNYRKSLTQIEATLNEH